MPSCLFAHRSDLIGHHEFLCICGGPDLRRRPLALGLLNAQRYQTNDARYCSHLHVKVVALSQTTCGRRLADGYGCIAKLQDF